MTRNEKKRLNRNEKKRLKKLRGSKNASSTPNLNRHDSTDGVSIDEIQDLRSLILNTITENSPDSDWDVGVVGDGFNMSFEFGGKKWFIRGEIDTRFPSSMKGVPVGASYRDPISQNGEFLGVHKGPVGDAEAMTYRSGVR